MRAYVNTFEDRLTATLLQTGRVVVSVACVSVVMRMVVGSHLYMYVYSVFGKDRSYVAESGTWARTSRTVSAPLTPTPS